MRLEDLPESTNVSDRRGMARGGVAAGGGGILLLILGLVFGVDTSKLGLGGGSGGPAPQRQVQGVRAQGGRARWRRCGRPSSEAIERLPATVRTTEADPVLRRRQDGRCGFAPAEVGPFYCPGDKTMYLDPTFFEELERQARRVQGGVLAGLRHRPRDRPPRPEPARLFAARRSRSAARGRRTSTPSGSNSRPTTSPASGRTTPRRSSTSSSRATWNRPLTSAKAIGDDRIQKRSGGFVHPEKFNHGTSRSASRRSRPASGPAMRRKAKLDQFFVVGFERRQRGELDVFR